MVFFGCFFTFFEVLVLFFEGFFVGGVEVGLGFEAGAGVGGLAGGGALFGGGVGLVVLGVPLVIRPPNPLINLPPLLLRLPHDPQKHQIPRHLLTTLIHRYLRPIKKLVLQCESSLPS